MGGMIAQTMVIEHPELILSLTSIMSTTGNPDVGGAKAELMMKMPLTVPTSKEEAIEASVETFRLISGPHFDAEDHAEERWIRRPKSLRNNYDVVIIGGGGHGLACAYYLAKKSKLKVIRFPVLITNFSNVSVSTFPTKTTSIKPESIPLA